MKFVEELIVAHNDDEEYLKIPPLGRHYTLRWAEDDLHQEQREGSRYGDKKKNTSTSLGTEDTQRLLDSVAKNKYWSPLLIKLIISLKTETWFLLIFQP